MIDYGITNFDNLGAGIVTIFQMITLEGWTKIMYNLMDSDIPIMAASFSVLLVVVASFFLLNVILAVLSEAYEKVDANTIRQTEALQKKISKSVRRAKKQQEKRRKLAEDKGKPKDGGD